MSEETTDALIRELLRRAFVAGFTASTEGFNYAESFFEEHAPYKLPYLTPSQIQTLLDKSPALQQLMEAAVIRLAP